MKQFIIRGIFLNLIVSCSRVEGTACNEGEAFYHYCSGVEGCCISSYSVRLDVMSATPGITPIPGLHYNSSNAKIPQVF